MHWPLPFEPPRPFKFPQPYVIAYSFSNFQANNPTKPLPAPALDAELANIATAIKSIDIALAYVQRSDGELRNGVVTYDSLSPELLWRLGLPRPPVRPVNVAQLKHSLALVAAVGIVDAAINADYNDIANIIWTTGGITSLNDELSILIANTLSYSQERMSALYARAERLTTLLPRFGSVTVTQLKKALAQSAQVAAVDAGMPADYNDLVNIQWTTGGTTSLGDPLANFLTTFFSYSPAQIAALYALASTMKP